MMANSLLRFFLFQKKMTENINKGNKVLIMKSYGGKLLRFKPKVVLRNCPILFLFDDMGTSPIWGPLDLTLESKPPVARIDHTKFFLCAT